MKKRSPTQFDRLSVENFKKLTKRPLVIVLDNVRSGHNVGATLRISDAFLIEKVYLCGITPQPPHREIRKTSLGAEESVAWSHANKTSELLHQLKEQGYLIVAVEQTDASVPLHQLPPPQTSERPYALVFGHEVFGVSDEALALVDTCIEIPQHGTKHSLNVATCIGIVVWELLKNSPS